LRRRGLWGTGVTLTEYLRIYIKEKESVSRFRLTAGEPPQMLKGDSWTQAGETLFTQGMLTRLARKLVSGQELVPDTTLSFTFDGYDWSLTARSEPRCIEIELLIPPAPPESAAPTGSRGKKRTAKLGLGSRKPVEADASTLSQAMTVNVKKNPVKPVKLPSWVRSASSEIEVSQIAVQPESAPEAAEPAPETLEASPQPEPASEAAEPGPEALEASPQPEPASEAAEPGSEAIDASPPPEPAPEAAEPGSEAIEASPSPPEAAPEAAEPGSEAVEASPQPEPNPEAAEPGSEALEASPQPESAPEAAEPAPEALEASPSPPESTPEAAEPGSEAIDASPSPPEAAPEAAEPGSEAVEASPQPEPAPETAEPGSEAIEASPPPEPAPEAAEPGSEALEASPVPEDLSAGLELLRQPILEKPTDSELTLTPPAVVTSIDSPPARDWILELPIEGIEAEAPPAPGVATSLELPPRETLRPEAEVEVEVEVEATFDIPVEDVPPLTETLAALGLDLNADSPVVAPLPQPVTQAVSAALTTMADLQTLTAGRPGSELAFPPGGFPLMTLGNLPISVGSKVFSHEEVEQIVLARPLELEPHQPVHGHWKLENGQLLADSPLLPECKLKTPAAEVLAERPGQLVIRRDNSLLYLDPNGKIWELESNPWKGIRRPQVEIRGSWVWVLSWVARPKRWLNIGKDHEVQLVRYSILGEKAVGARFGKFSVFPLWSLSPNGVYCGWLRPRKKSWRLEIINSLEEQIEGHFDLPSAAPQPEELLLSDEGDFALQLGSQAILGERTPKGYKTYPFSLEPSMNLESVDSTFGLLARTEARFQHQPPLMRGWSPLPPDRDQLEALAKSHPVVQAHARGPVVYWDQTWKAVPLECKNPGDWKHLNQQFSQQEPVSLIQIGGEKRFLQKLPAAIQISRFRAIQHQGRWRIVSAENCQPSDLQSS